MPPPGFTLAEDIIAIISEVRNKQIIMTTIACSCSCSPDSLFYGMCEFTGCPFGGHAITKEPSISDKENVDNGSHFRSTLEEDLIPAPKRFKFSDESQMKKLAEG